MGLVDQFGKALTSARDAVASLVLPGATATERAYELARADTQKMWEGFDASMREPEPTWQEELDRLAPPSDRQSRLLVRWYPGYPWAPVHRWMIYQLTPKEVTPDLILQHLEGPDPRTLGAYDKGSQRYYTPSRVTRYQWDIYKETGCYAASYWVVQGNHGGHKAKFSKMESFLSMSQGGPTQPPDPGALPYAPFDQRVLVKLQQFKRLKDYMDRGAELERDEAAAEEKLRALLWEWMGTQIMEELDGKDALLRRAFPEGSIPRSSASMARIEEQGRESFIKDE